MHVQFCPDRLRNFAFRIWIIHKGMNVLQKLLAHVFLLPSRHDEFPFSKKPKIAWGNLLKCPSSQLLTTLQDKYIFQRENGGSQFICRLRSYASYCYPTNFVLLNDLVSKLIFLFPNKLAFSYSYSRQYVTLNMVWRWFSLGTAFCPTHS